MQKKSFYGTNRNWSFRILNRLPLTSVSSVGLFSALVLNLPVQGLGCLFTAGIILIPPHTQNIKQHSASLHVV